MKAGFSITELQNSVIGKIIDSEAIVRALVIKSENFLEATPTEEQLQILQSPDLLIRKQIMPFRNVTSLTPEAMPYITSAWVNFKKISNNYKNGRVVFYIIVPNSLEKTDYGIRYNFIADKLDELLSSSGIGKFEFDERSDYPIDSSNLGHYISFNILDFYGV